MEWWDVVASHMTGFNLELHAHLFQDDGNGMFVRTDLWPDDLPTAPDAATLASWLAEVTE
jgi:hypothetical protein